MQRVEAVARGAARALFEGEVGMLQHTVKQRVVRLARLALQLHQVLDSVARAEGVVVGLERLQRFAQLDAALVIIAGDVHQVHQRAAHEPTRQLQPTRLVQVMLHLLQNHVA
jgi:hypothetical protein